MCSDDWSNPSLVGDLVSVNQPSDGKLVYYTLDGLMVDAFTGIRISSVGDTGLYLCPGYTLQQDATLCNVTGEVVASLSSGINFSLGDCVYGCNSESGVTDVYNANAELVKQLDGCVQYASEVDPGIFMLSIYNPKIPSESSRVYVNSQFEEISYTPHPGTLVGSLQDGTELYSYSTNEESFIVDRNSNPVVLGGYTVALPNDGNSYSGWNNVQRASSDFYFAKDSEGKFGAVNSAGEVLVPFVYDSYYDAGKETTDYFLVKKDEEWFFRSIDPQIVDASFLIPDTVYDGTRKVAISGSHAGVDLVEGIDFSIDKVTFDFASGAGKVLVEGMGSFAGSIEVSFNVTVPPELTSLDVPADAWFSEASAYAVANGLITGYDNGLFGPTDVLTRAQAATVLWRYFAPREAEAYDKMTTDNTTGMIDVDSFEWYTGAANWAVANKVINGMDNKDGTFSFEPNGAITREQLCAIVGNAAKTFCGDEFVGSDPAKLNSMPDVTAVSDWAGDSVAWGLNKGVISGWSEAGVRYIKPQMEVDRGTMAAVMMNAIEENVIGKN